MQYIPDTYRENKEIDDDLFLKLQFKYRHGISLFLSQFVEFNSIDSSFDKSITIPVIDDSSYNFYHKNSYLGSKYLILRNNIHIERLTPDELKQLIDNDFLDLTFYADTYQKVMFEDGDSISYGLYPNDINTKKSKALIFEFAFDQSRCESMNQIRYINALTEELFAFIKERMDKNNIETDFLVYQCLPEIFVNKEKNNVK